MPHSAGNKRWQRTTKLEKGLLGAVIFLLLLVVILVAVSIYSSWWKSKNEFCDSPACVQAAASIIESMDITADPCEDFHQYACGNWGKMNPFPEGMSTYSTMMKIAIDNLMTTRSILEDENYVPTGEAEKKSLAYYSSCIDRNNTVEQLGAQPMMDLLSKIGGWNISGSFNAGSWNFQHSMELVHNYYDHGSVFAWTMFQDLKDTTRYIIMFDEGALGLSATDYYLSPSARHVLNAYLTYMTEVGVLLGGEETSTRRQMEAVIDFETKLASIMLPPEMRADASKSYHKITVSDLQKLSPVVNWLKFLNFGFNQVDKRISPSQEIIVSSTEYFRKMNDLVSEYLFHSEKKIVLVNYVAWILVSSMTRKLSTPFQKAADMLDNAMTGAESSVKSWRDCLGTTNQDIGEPLGAMFVRQVFKGDSKPVAREMQQEIRSAFKDNFPNLKWMDEETRKVAEEKVDAITELIGYPDYITNSTYLDKKYHSLEIHDGEYFKNNIAVGHFKLLENMRLFGQPVDNQAWSQLPQTENAFYMATKNQIIFPAGLLRAPYFDIDRPKYLNFGAIGMVIGHELTHAFDTSGRQYDKYGNLRQWWNNATIQRFVGKAQCFIDQYSSYKVNGINLNGLKGLVENIADNGGLKAAYHAYQNWAGKNPTELRLPGLTLTNNQLFFVSFGQAWCDNNTPEALQHHMLNDGHTIRRYRIIAVLSNSVDFSKEFNCKANSPMNPQKKCEVY